MEQLRRNWDLIGKKIKEVEDFTLLKFNSNGGKRGPKMKGNSRSSSLSPTYHWWHSGGPCYCNCSVSQWGDATATVLNSCRGWICIILFSPPWGVLLVALFCWNHVPQHEFMEVRPIIFHCCVCRSVHLYWNLCSSNANMRRHSDKALQTMRIFFLLYFMITHIVFISVDSIHHYLISPLCFYELLLESPL